MTAMAISKFSARHFLKSRLRIDSSSQGSIVTTVAERGLVVDQPHLAEELTRAEDAQDHFLALGVAHHHLEPPGQHDVE